MITVDGRTDREKLLELLANGTEERELDYKQYLDLAKGASKHSVELAKDCAAMANLPRGGYIVVGAEDNGKVATSAPPITVGQFDSADVRSKVRPFIDGPLHIACAVHDVDSRLVALIYVRPDDSGLPVLMKKNGEFTHPSGRSETLFYKGQMLTRGGSSNEMAYEHWEDALVTYRARIVREAARHTDAVLQQILFAIREGKPDGTPIAPLFPDMDQPTLADSLATNFRGGDAGQTHIRQFVGAVRGSARPTAESIGESALDQLCLVALCAIEAGNSELFDYVIETFNRLYTEVAEWQGEDAYLPPETKSQYFLNVLVRIFIIGSRLVREKLWGLIAPLVLRPVEVEPTYRYTTWLRHGQVQASRHNLLRGEDGTGGNMLAVCRSHMIEHPELRADRPEVPVQVEGRDALLDSLCQFDMLWCLITAAQPNERLGFQFYPSFAVYFGTRTEPVLDLLVRSEAMRTELFRETTAEVVANAMLQVIAMSGRESVNHGFHNEIRPSPAVAEFIENHASAL